MSLTKFWPRFDFYSEQKSWCKLWPLLVAESNEDSDVYRWPIWQFGTYQSTSLNFTDGNVTTRVGLIAKAAPRIETFAFFTHPSRQVDDPCRRWLAAFRRWGLIGWPGATVQHPPTADHHSSLSPQPGRRDEEDTEVRGGCPRGPQPPPVTLHEGPVAAFEPPVLQRLP